MAASAFDAETAVVARGNGRYDAQLSTAWDIGDNANGGYAMLPVLRALREESDHADPLSITTHFLRPIQGGGDARIDTSLVRSGRSVSVVTGDLTVAETRRLTVSAVFGDINDTDDNHSGAAIDVPAPMIPPPEECVDRAELLQGVALPIASRLDVRIPSSSAVAGESNRAITEGWVQLSDGTPPTVLSLPLFADAFPPSLFAKLGSVGWVPTIELTVHVRRRPANGWIQARFECDDLVGGRMIESGTLWDRTGRVVARSRQLGLLLGT
jgi:acyl-CoA thioesterase